MSESSDKRRNFSRRQPTNRRPPQNQGEKVGKKKVKVPLQQPRPPKKQVALTRVNHNMLPPPTATGVRRSKPGLVMPAAVKPIGYMNGMTPALNPHTVNYKTVRVQKPAMPKMGRRASRKTRLKPMARTMLYALRLLIVGVGIGAIVGTILSVLDPATRMPSNSAASSGNVGTNQPQLTANPAAGLYLSQEITSLKNAVQNLATANPNLTPGVFFVDLETGGYVDVNSAASFSAASTIKVPILIAFFQDVDAGKVRLDEMLTMEKDMVAGGSGNLQYQKVGTQYSALELATLMSTSSDNTATNMVIARLGGMEALNQRFQTWGLSATAIRNPLPDLAGTNTTSPRELGSLLAMVNQGNLVSMRSRDMILDIMRRTERNHLLPSGLGTGARIHHKTGDIATMLGDVGLIDIPTGKRYIAAVMVQRPNNDPVAEKLISAISSAAYQQFSQNIAPNPLMNAPVPPNMGNTMPPNATPVPFSPPQTFPSR
ncbi:serine hydrolase [Nodularia sphaerocarpa]|uniref:serine hydrolase n=1 Tax=Nodularia sphaerocarpa TaxID=137816 RepID=UPI001EFB878E|nr:serine hydrolase [Nodularia sphaerocarpa]MDB9372115.1 class A beta-lactamase-related serine hydrolase [Nodularia sphaerocarpa CS-585]MDB9379572.1 class A beta-lactamase-related serine hydrolase [Nodularia sphaerocarpa CS-585A2]ULP70408.1 Beta-lactamase [Nodularia sphaerocarpa UHCC 0038]